MTLEQLRIFVAVAERQHMTRAAEALHLAQSAVSSAIAALEERHRTALFHRVGRGIELTEAGRVFLVEAQAVLSRVEAAELTLAEFAGLTRGTLSVQASQTISSYWLPAHLVRFRNSYPGIEIRLSVGNTAQAVRAVRDGTAELGFVEGPVDDPALASMVVARDRLVLVVAPDHPWVQRPPEHGDLAAAKWVLREPGSGTRATFEPTLERFGIRPEALDVALELPSNEAVRAAVEAGAGATVISESVVASSLATGALKEIPIELAERTFQLLRHRERYASKAADALVDMIKEAAAQRPRITPS